MMPGWGAVDPPEVETELCHVCGDEFSVWDLNDFLECPECEREMNKYE
jgi:hypothetical protein